MAKEMVSDEVFAALVLLRRHAGVVPSQAAGEQGLESIDRPAEYSATDDPSPEAVPELDEAFDDLIGSLDDDFYSDLDRDIIDALLDPRQADDETATTRLVIELTKAVVAALAVEQEAEADLSGAHSEQKED